MNLKRLPWWRLAFLVMTFVGLFGYEIAGLLDPLPDDTWSEHVWWLSGKSLLFVGVCWFVWGHFWWQRKRP